MTEMLKADPAEQMGAHWVRLRRFAGPMLQPLIKSGMAVAIADAARPGRPLILVNAAFTELTGVGATDIAASECRLDDWIGQAETTATLDALPEGESASLQVRTRRDDGSSFWNVLTLTPIANESGHEVYILVTAADAMAARDARDLESILSSKRQELARIGEQVELGWKLAGASGAWEWDIASETLYADVRFATLCGLSPTEASSGVPGRLFFSTIHPDDRLRVRIAVAAALQGAEVFARDYRIRSSDGSVRWVSARGRSHLDGDDQPVRFSGVQTDITDQKRVEEQLQLAQTAGGVGTFLYESGFGTAEVSEEFCRLLGFHPAKVLPVRTINSVVHPDDAPLIGGVASALSGELPYSEIRIRRADDGSERWLALRGQVREEGGGLCFMGAIYDVTGSKQVQDRLRELNLTLEDRVRARTRERDRVWNLSRDLFNVCDPQGVQKAVNPAWTQELGYPAEDLIGTRFDALVHPDEKAAFQSILADVAAGRSVPDFDLHLVAHDGEWRCINWTITAEDEDLYCVGRDVTTRLQLQDELRQSQKMEAVGQLTGGLAHDFNNMLTGVIGCLDIVKRRIESGRIDDLDRFMDAATSSAQRAAALTHRLLAFSRRQPLDSKPFDVNVLARSMEELLRRTLGEQIELVVRVDDRVLLAIIDPNQLESAVLNLALNARDAMAQGGRLTIEARRVAIQRRISAVPDDIPPGEYACLTVSDTGSGMPAEVLERAFEPFFTTKPIGKGTGLGLSMIDGFVQQSRGHLVIDSVVGRGTSVTLYLPVHGGEMLIEDTSARTHTPSGSGEQVLVIEDDASVRLLVLDVLQELNYTGIESHDGQEALQVLDSTAPIRLLITDVGLPGLNGRQVAEIARQKRPDLPVLFMTAYAPDAIDRGAFLDTGMDMISKPFTMDAMATKVRAILDGTREK
ncbi:MAG: sensor hybrid histidine kinase [Hyphomicrobiales bacterium]|nr:sensor hybrid histidine kinase [Hyphomicrobiales bacterium]